MPDANESPAVECVIPVLGVQNLARSLAFYTETLGFYTDWGGETGKAVGSVSRDGHSIMLSELAHTGTPSTVWVGVSDANLFDAWQQAGVAVIEAPQNFTWAYSMKIADPDGNVLWLGTGPRADLPVVDA